MSKRDFRFILIIGGAVGLLIQPILANTLPNVQIGLGLRALIFFVFLILAPLALWAASFISKWWGGIYQFAQFAAVGTLNTFIDLGVFNLELFFYGSVAGSTLIFAAFKAISFLCATTNSFFWNKYWTFSSTGKAEAKQVTSFYVIAAVGWALNVGAFTLMKALGPGGTGSAAHLWVGLAAPLAGVAASFLWDFLGYKYLVFKKT